MELGFLEIRMLPEGVVFTERRRRLNYGRNDVLLQNKFSVMFGCRKIKMLSFFKFISLF